MRKEQPEKQENFVISIRKEVCNWLGLIGRNIVTVTLIGSFLWLSAWYFNRWQDAGIPQDQLNQLFFGFLLGFAPIFLSMVLMNQMVHNESLYRINKNLKDLDEVVEQANLNLMKQEELSRKISEMNITLNQLKLMQHDTDKRDGLK